MIFFLSHFRYRLIISYPSIELVYYRIFLSIFYKRVFLRFDEWSCVLICDFGMTSPLGASSSEPTFVNRPAPAGQSAGGMFLHDLMTYTPEADQWSWVLGARRYYGTSSKTIICFIAFVNYEIDAAMFGTCAYNPSAIECNKLAHVRMRKLWCIFLCFGKIKTRYRVWVLNKSRVLKIASIILKWIIQLT